MTRPLLPLRFLFVALSLCAFSAQAQVNKELFDARKVAKVTIPLSWNVSKQKIVGIDGISSGGGSHADKSLLFLFVFDRENLKESDVPLEDFLQAQVENLENGSIGMAKGKIRDGKINGKPSKYLRADVKTKSADLVVYWSAIDAGKRIYLVQGSCHKANQKEREPEILSAMKSFREIKTE